MHVHAVNPLDIKLGLTVSVRAVQLVRINEVAVRLQKVLLKVVFNFDMFVAPGALLVSASPSYVV